MIHKFATRQQTAIYQWMRAHAGEFVDPKTGEVDLTAMVDAWDRAHGQGGDTVDPDHPAWDIATIWSPES